MDGLKTVFPERLAAVSLVALLVASAIVAVPTPLRAVDGSPDHLPGYSACTGDANNSSGFLDVVGHIAEQGINCLAYYGITLGQTPELFAPDQPITRRQMALFLVRAALPAGVTVPPPSDQGFQDIGHHSRNTQDAINQMAALGITRGTSPTTFHPDSPIDRRQMALFLYRFLQLAPTGPGGADASQVTPDDNVFTDLNGQPAQVIEAVRVIYEMGVTLGATRTTFSPGTLLTRGQMALFVTRALAHTNARPIGVTMQSRSPVISFGDTLEVQVSLRDSTFRPRPGWLVDLFSTSILDLDGSFATDGACRPVVEAAIGQQACMIDRFDQKLDESGNLLLLLEPPDSIRLWAWTGNLKSEFQLGATPSVSLDINVLKPSSALRVTDDMQPTAKVLPSGKSIEFAFQLVDEDGRPVSETGVGIQVSTTYATNGISDLTRVVTYRTDAAGRVTASYPASDTGLSAKNPVITLDIDVLAQGLNVLDRTTLGVVAGDGSTNDAALIWSDEAPEPSTLRLRHRVGYHELPESGTGPGPVNVITGILTDQYGGPVPNTQIEFSSDANDGVGRGPTVRITNERGVAILRYIWNGTVPVAEAVTAFASRRAVMAPPLIHYWASPQDKGLSALAVPFLLQDAGNNVILHDPDTPRLVRYDDNDTFSVAGTRVNIDTFEEALTSGAYTRISYGRYSLDPSTSNWFDLTNTRQFDSA